MPAFTRYAASAAATRHREQRRTRKPRQQNQAVSQCRRDPTRDVPAELREVYDGSVLATVCKAEGRICTGIHRPPRAASTRYSTMVRPCAPSPSAIVPTTIPIAANGRHRLR